MAEGALLLNAFYLLVWVIQNFAHTAMVGPAEIVIGVLLPLLNFAALVVSRYARSQGWFQVGIRSVAVILNCSLVLLVLPGVAVEIFDHYRGTGAELSYFDLRAAALLLLLPCMNLVAMSPWLRVDLADTTPPSKEF